MLSARLGTTTAAARIPKDMTRITSGLLASRRFKGVPMLKSGTHYEQVPLAVVRKILEEQILSEPTIEPDQGTRKTKLEEDLIEEQQQTVAGFGAFSERKS
jgi:predicted type IV restriction endonuclease